MKKFVIICLIIIAITTLPACGSKTDESGTPSGAGAGAATHEDQFFEYQKLSIIIPDDITAKDFVITDNSIMLLTNSGIISINYGGEMNEVIPHIGNESFTQLSIDGDGNFNILAMGKNEDGTTNLTVNHFKNDGAKLPRTALKGPFAEEEDNPYIIDFLTANGHYYVQSMFGVYVYNGAGELVQAVREESDTLANSLFLTEDGMMTSVSTRNRDNASLLVVRVFEPDASDFTEHIIGIGATSSGSLLTSGGRLGLLSIEDNGIYEYALETGRGNQLLSLLEHGVNSSDIIGLSLKPNGDIICVLPRGSVLSRTAGDFVVFSSRPDHVRGTMEAYQKGEEQIIVDTGPPKEKETVTLAILRLSNNFDWLQMRVALFNKTNPDYMIEIIDYWHFSDEEDARKRFIISLTHDPADIIVLTNWRRQLIPIHSYSRKGLFTDLYEIMETDPSFNKADYLPNVFKALEMDGKLYSIFPTFEIWANIGKASDFGETTIGWTLDEFISFLDTKPEAEYIIGEWTREDFITNMIEFYFTDPETGGMMFDREDFLKILSAAERFPKFSPSIESYEDWNAFNSGAKTGNPLMYRSRISGGVIGPRFERVIEYVLFGEDISYKGLPSPTGSGTYFLPSMRFAITEKSQRKDGAWEFIKFMMDVYEDPSWWLNTQLTIKISQLESDLAATLVNPLYGTENEYVHFYHLDTDTIAGKTIPVGNNTPELNAKIMEVITTTTVVAPNDQVVRDIIEEEVAFYLAGQKTPNQVADIIENRVGIYLSELD